MKNRFLILLIGGLLFLPLIGPARADVSFSIPHVGPAGAAYDNYWLEQGANGTIRIRFRNPYYDRSVLVSVAKLYMNYKSGLINSLTVASNYSSNLIIGQDYLVDPGDGVAGTVRLSLTNVTGSSTLPPLEVTAGTTVALATISFHVNQAATIGYAANFIQWYVENQAVNVKVSTSAGENVTGARINYDDNAATQINLETSLTPQFDWTDAANTAVVDARTGNALDLSWAAAETAARDRQQKAETLYASGLKLRYWIHMSTVKEGTVGAKINANALNATAERVGSTTGIPAAGSEQLSDCQTYYFNLNGQDDCTPIHNEQIGLTQRSATPHDYTPPATPTGFAAVGSDATLTLSWNPNPGNAADFGGVVLYRTTNLAAAAPVLNNAGIIGGDVNADGTQPPAQGETTQGETTQGETTADGNWYVAYSSRQHTTGTDNGVTDGGLVNGTSYRYLLYAYDRVVAGPPREQGYNYSPSTTVTAAPGIAPSAVTNFTALTRPAERQIELSWINPPESFYLGNRILAATTPALWEGIAVNSDTADPDHVVLVGEFTDVHDLTAPIILNTYGPDAAALDPNQIYYFKAFSYNNAPDVVNRKYGPEKQAAALPMSAAALPTFITVALHKEATGSGLNTFAFPFDTRQPFSINGIPMAGTSTLDLINAINTAAGEPALITSFGWFLRQDQLQYGASSLIYNGLTVDANQSTFTPAGNSIGILENDIDGGVNNPDYCFSIGVNRDFSFKMMGVKRQ